MTFDNDIGTVNAKQVYLNSHIWVEIKIRTSMDQGKISTLIWLLLAVNSVASEVCDNANVNNLLGNTARNVSGWNIYINYGQFEGNNSYFFAKSICIIYLQF